MWMQSPLLDISNCQLRLHPVCPIVSLIYILHVCMCVCVCVILFRFLFNILPTLKKRELSFVAPDSQRARDDLSLHYPLSLTPACPILSDWALFIFSLHCIDCFHLWAFKFVTPLDSIKIFCFYRSSNLFKNKREELGAVPHSSLWVTSLFLVHHLFKQFSLLGPRGEGGTGRLWWSLLVLVLFQERRGLLLKPSAVKTVERSLWWDSQRRPCRVAWNQLL